MQKSLYILYFSQTAVNQSYYDCCGECSNITTTRKECSSLLQLFIEHEDSEPFTHSIQIGDIFGQLVDGLSLLVQVLVLEEI